MVIVVVEDDATIGELACELFEPDGHEVRFVHDNFGAIPPAVFAGADVVLADYMLPGATGCEVLRQAERVAPRARLLCWTAAPHAVMDDPTCDGLTVLAKPVGINELRSLVAGA